MSVFANGRSILHKGHGKTQLAMAPDVCKTPSPGGPVPIPYPNMSPDSNLTKGVPTVTINGNPVANTESQLSRSNGDEAGTAGGLVSSKNMGAFGWPAGSVDVVADGKGVVRLLDSVLTNGNSYNDTGVNIGQTGLYYGDDMVCPREDCRLDRVIERHRVPETHDMSLACEDFSDQVTGGVAGSSRSFQKRFNRGAGRMLGVGICECGRLWKAVSGAPIPDGNPILGINGIQNTIGALAQDAFMTGVRESVPTWSCAALKIISNASGHKIVALSEKWLGSPAEGGGRTPKTYSQQLFNVVLPSGLGVSIPLPYDQIPGAPAGPIPSGDSVPSCGTCQTFLPAVICQMDECG
jgi:Toxin PAAR-like domain